MRIILQNKNQKEWRLYVPNALLLNRLTAFWLAKGLVKRGIQLPRKRRVDLAKSIKAICRRHPEWVLLEAEQSSGERIKIIL